MKGRREEVRREREETKNCKEGKKMNREKEL